MSYNLRERSSSAMSDEDFLAKFYEKINFMKKELINENRNEIRKMK